MAESHFNVWNETVEDGPGGQSRFSVVSLDGGYVAVRRDPTSDRLYFGTGDDPTATYSPSFGGTDVTRPVKWWFEDEALGSHVVFSFAYEGRAHFVTADAAATSARVVVFDPSWVETVAAGDVIVPGSYTVTLGHNAHDLQWFVQRKFGQVKFIEATPSFSDPDLTALVGEFVIPDAEIERYGSVGRDGNSYSVFPPMFSPVTVTASTATHTHSLPKPSGLSGYSVSSVEHLTTPQWWTYVDPWVEESPEQNAHEWVHYVRRVWFNGTTYRSSVQDVYFGLEFTYSGVPYSSGSSAYAANRGFNHDQDTHFPVGSFPYFVKFTDTRWEFYYYTSNNPNFLLFTWVDYPFTPDQVLQPVGYDGREGTVIVGPVVVDNGKPYLFALQPVPYDYPLNDPFYPSSGVNDGTLGEDGVPGEGSLELFAFALDGSPLVNDLDVDDTTYDVSFHFTRPIITADDIGTPVVLSAAVSFTADNPVNSSAADVQHMAFVSQGVSAGLEYVDYDDVDGDSGVDAPWLDGTVAIETPLNPTADLPLAGWSSFLDGVAVLAVQQNPTEDVWFVSDTADDSAVVLWEDYEDENLITLSEPHLVLSPSVTLLEDYEDEVVLLDPFDVWVDAADVSVSISIVFGDVTAVLSDGDLSADALIGAEGYSEGTPPTPGTCTAGTYTVTLPAGADPDIPLTYIVDGRLVTVMHDGVVVGAFYLPSPDLDDFCVTVLLSTGDPATDLPDPDVVVATPTYMVDTSMRSTDVFMVSEGDHEGTVFVGPSVFITGNEVEVMWDFASPDDIEGKRVVWLFGYENPPIDFNDAALIAASGNGKYLIPVLP